jgi:hypothetical protein
MKIYTTLKEMPHTSDPYTLNWECKNKGCWDGPCFMQHDKKPRGCPGFGRRLIGDPTPKWEEVKDERYRPKV